MGCRFGAAPTLNASKRLSSMTPARKIKGLMCCEFGAARARCSEKALVDDPCSQNQRFDVLQLRAAPTFNASKRLSSMTPAHKIKGLMCCEFGASRTQCSNGDSRRRPVRKNSNDDVLQIRDIPRSICEGTCRCPVRKNQW